MIEKPKTWPDGNKHVIQDVCDKRYIMSITGSINTLDLVTMHLFETIYKLTMTVFFVACLQTSEY